MHIDPILIEKLVKIEKPCLTDDLAWLDETREDNEDKEFLDITALVMKLIAL